MKYNTTTSLGTAAMRLLVVGSVVVLVAAGVVGTYVWRQHKINSLNQQVSSLQAQLQSARQNPATPTPTPTASPSPTPSPQLAGTSYTSEKGATIVLYAPTKNAKVSSPVAVIGEVPGSWSFEASFPIRLEDSSGGMIAQGTAQVLGDWMTNQLVPFSAKLTYASSPSGSGKLVLQKDNPSGLAQNADTVSVPVQF